MLVGRDLPKLFKAEPEFLWFTRAGEIEFRDQLLAEIAARAFREQRVFGAQLDATREAVFRLLVFANSHIADSNTGNCVAFEQNLGSGKARIDFNAERFGFSRQPAADATE